MRRGIRRASSRLRERSGLRDEDGRLEFERTLVRGLQVTLAAFAVVMLGFALVLADVSFR